MLKDFLGSLLKSGGSAPKQIEVKDSTSENVFLYAFAAVVLIIVATVFIQLFKK